MKDGRRAFSDPLLWSATIVYAVLYFTLGAVRYAAHRNFVDLGIFAQTAASAFGCFCNTVEGSHWAFHFSPVLYAAGALVRVWPSALALVALSAVAGALAIPPVYALVFRYADRRAARLSALVVFLYPPLAGAIFNDFHENSIAPAAVSWLLWAFDGGYVWATIAFAAVTLAVKEDQAVFLAAAGVTGYFRYRGDRPRSTLAAGVGVASALVLLGFFGFIQPAAAHQAHWAPTRFYAWTPADVSGLFPYGLLVRAGFVLLAFVPLLFLPFRTGAGLLLVLPLLEVLLSRDSTTYTVGSHYAGAWAGYAFYGLACALRPMFVRNAERVHRTLIWCAVLCAIEFAVANPLHPGFFLHARTARDVRLDRFLGSLPPGTSIATQEEAYSHLAATDPNATVLPETPSGVIVSCYILLDEEFADSPRLVEAGPLVRKLVARGVYSIARRDDAISLYKRSSGCR